MARLGVLAVSLVAVPLLVPHLQHLDGPGRRDPVTAQAPVAASTPAMSGSAAGPASAAPSQPSASSAALSPGGRESAAVSPEAGAVPGPGGQGGAGQPDTPGRDTEEFDEYECDTYNWDLPHPALAKTCVARAGSPSPAVLMLGVMQALPGVQADFFLTMTSVTTGKVVGTPEECLGLMFTDFEPEHECGPFAVTLVRGERYRLTQQWRYTERGLLPGGNTRTFEFTF